jgi:hypothetical protein
MEFFLFLLLFISIHVYLIMNFILLYTSFGCEVSGRKLRAKGPLSTRHSASSVCGQGRCEYSAQPTTGDPQAWRLGVGITCSLIIKNRNVTNYVREPLAWADSFIKRPKLRNMDMRFGTWNVRSLYRAGSLKAVSRELARYMLELVGVQEVR